MTASCESLVAALTNALHGQINLSVISALFRFEVFSSA